MDLDRDRTLVERCQAGDSAAFGSLYARYYERLLRFCLRRLNDRHEAEDAAQEAFARAWKALPQFAGERRFYPWLTVIAGNICTDMLRRRSRSTPTDDLELTAHRTVGVVGDDTSEDLALAAVDGELVNRALGRLSVRHRHVLAMREGSGWTYQQIADHEGVNIGTVETLLWRARQAFKREFALVTESKDVLAGFLIAGGALIRRSVLRIVHRGAALQQNGGGLRTAVAGVAVTGAAVAAAFITPHALSSGHAGTPVPLAAPAASALANPPFRLTTPAPATPASAGSGSGATALISGATGSGASSSGPVTPATPGTTGSGSGSPGSSLTLGGLSSNGAGGTGGLAQAAGGVATTVGGAVNGVTNTVGGAVNGVTNTVGGAVNGVAGGPGSPGTGSSTPSSTPAAPTGSTTTTTTSPSLLGGLGHSITPRHDGP